MLPDSYSDSNAVAPLFRVVAAEMDEVIPDTDTDPDAVDNNTLAHERACHKLYGPRPCLIPAPRNDDPESLHRIPTTYLNRIQGELESGQYDYRIVLTKCRGLQPGSREFADRYFAARLKVLGARRIPSGSADLMRPPGTPAEDADADEVPHPRMSNTGNTHCIRSLWDLYRHFGNSVRTVLVLELWISWKLAEILDEFLLGGPLILGALVFSCFLMLDSILWFRYRNNNRSKITVPARLLVIILVILATGLYFYQLVPAAIERDPDAWRVWYEKHRTM